MHDSMNPPILLGRYCPPTTATDNTVLQAPRTKRRVCTAVTICNADTATRTYRLHICKLEIGEAAAVANAIDYDVRISANTTTRINGSLESPVFVLDRTQEVVGRVDVASKITFHFWGYDAQ